MEKNLSCSRVLAWLVVYQIVELQLTAQLQKSATKFYNRPWYFLQIRSKISERRLRQILSPYVVVEKPLKYTIVEIVHSNHQQKIA